MTGSVRPGTYSPVMQRLRALSEAECYARCYGERAGMLRVVSVEPRRPRYKLDVTGEDLRTSFEERLDARAVAEAEAA
jgi:hypothetical protein